MFAWGRNDEGQLGVGDKEERVVPTLVTGLLRTKSVVQVAAGNRHRAYLTAGGLVFLRGSNDNGQLGVGHTGDRACAAPTLAIVRDGLQGRQVMQVAAGIAHTMCITEDGAVFGWGRNVHGQLGLGDTENRVAPTLLRVELDNEPIVQITAGCAHSACITVDGLVFTCGFNSYGHLAVGNAEDTTVPTLVTGQLQGKTAVYIASGDNHTLCTIADSSLFAWGKNESGQLGVGDTVSKQVPTLVTQLRDKQVVHVTASEQHSLCTTADGSVFAWGAGQSGQLGLGNEIGQSDDVLGIYIPTVVPTVVRGGLDSPLENKAVVQVAADEDQRNSILNHVP